MSKKADTSTEPKHQADVELRIRKKYGNRMSKLLGVVDPKNGDQWFRMITTKSLEEKGFTLGLEKLNALRLADVSNETRIQWLKNCLGGAVARDQYNIPLGDKMFRIWVAREVFYEALRLEALRILELCQDVGGNPFPIGFFKIRQKVLKIFET